jgi:hypothetical protein
LRPGIIFEANLIQILAIRTRIELAKNGDWRVNHPFIT